MCKSRKIKAFPRVKVSASEYQETSHVIEVLDVPFAQIAREAIREKIAELKRSHPAFQQSGQQSEQVVIES